jgi:hypothetical protein
MSNLAEQSSEVRGRTKFFRAKSALGKDLLGGLRRGPPWRRTSVLAGVTRQTKASEFVSTDHSIHRSIRPLQACASFILFKGRVVIRRGRPIYIGGGFDSSMYSRVVAEAGITRSTLKSNYQL